MCVKVPFEVRHSTSLLQHLALAPSAPLHPTKHHSRCDRPAGDRHVAASIIMGRNVAVTVGALFRRAAVDQPPIWTASRPRIDGVSHRFEQSLAVWLPHRTFSSSNTRAIPQCSTPTNSYTRHHRLGAISAPPLLFLLSHTTRPRESVSAAAAEAWRRCKHTSAPKKIKKKPDVSKRNKSSVSNGASSKNRKATGAGAPQAELSPQPNAPPESTLKSNPESKSKPASHLSDYLPHSLPHLYRPSKAELLGAASGFWSRMKVHFKWLTIRSTRPFNADEIYALFSWILAAHIFWLVLGTTTFLSFTIFLINTVFAQETVAQWIGNYLTQSSGLKVVFESAVVPKWKDGTISFRNVFVSRRPGQGKAKVSKGSSTTAAAAAAAIAQKEKDIAEGVVEEEEDTNYTQFDVSIDTINVTLNFSKWMNGKGLLKDVEIKGIRGVIDRTSVHAPEEYVDPRTYKHEHHPGDFELDSFKMEDLLVTIYQPNNLPIPYTRSRRHIRAYSTTLFRRAGRIATPRCRY
jgi:mitochondrial distribution and morphology protein 31